MAFMELKTKVKCWAEFIYSCDMYSGLLEGVPVIDMGVDGCEKLKAIAKQLSPQDSLYIHEHLKVGKEVLPYRGNIALVDNAYRRGMVMWFDGGKLDARGAIAAIIDREGFDTMTKEYSI